MFKGIFKVGLSLTRITIRKLFMFQTISEKLLHRLGIFFLCM